MSEEQKCVKCGQHREHEEHNNTGTLSGYHIFQLEPLSEKVQAIERMAETHGFEPNTEHPLVCVRCGREHNNYKYHIANSEQVTVPVCEHGCDPKACRFPHEQEVTVPEHELEPLSPDDELFNREMQRLVGNEFTLRSAFQRGWLSARVHPDPELIERLGAAEHELKEAKSGWDSAIDDLRSAAEICREVEAERDRLKEQLAAMTQNRDQWERNSSAENKRAGDSGVTIRNLQAKVAELEGANAAHDAQVRREVLEKALNACCSICRDGRKHEGCPAQPIRALIEGGA